MSETIDFSIPAAGTALETTSGWTLLCPPGGKLTTNKAGGLDGTFFSGTTTQGFAAISRPVGAEAIESITISPRQINSCGAMLRAGTSGSGTAQIMTGYLLLVDSLTDCQIKRFDPTTGAIGYVANVTIPSSTLPLTLTCQNVGGVPQLTISQNGSQLGPVINDTGSPYTTKGTLYALAFNQNGTANTFVGPLVLGNIVAAAPTNTTLPTITGTAQVNSTLTVTPGTWTGTGTLTYQWFAGSAGAIAGATTLTYRPVSADVGKAITVTETDTATGGASTVTSAATAAVIASSGIADGSTGVTPPTARVAQANFSNTLGMTIALDFSCIKNSTTGSLPMTYDLYVNGTKYLADYYSTLDQMNGTVMTLTGAAAGWWVGMTHFAGTYNAQVVCTDPNVNPASTFARTVTMTTGAQPAVPGLVRLKNTAFDYHAFYVGSQYLAQCKADGWTVDYGSGYYDFPDGNQGVLSGQKWAAQFGAGGTAAGMKYVIQPGYSSRSTIDPDINDYTSAMDTALQDVNCLGICYYDESLTSDRNPTTIARSVMNLQVPEASGAPYVVRQSAKEFSDFYVAAKARATALAVPMKQTFYNAGEFLNPGDEQRAMLNATTGNVGSDKYFAADHYGRLTGYNNNGGLFMGTREMMSCYLATVNTTYRTQLHYSPYTEVSRAGVASLGSGFVAFIQFSTFGKFDPHTRPAESELARKPLPAENWSIMVSVLHLGNPVGIGGFMTHFSHTNASNVVDDPYLQYAFDPRYKPTLTRHKALTALLQSRGKLFAAAGDNTPTDFYPSPPVSSATALGGDSGGELPDTKLTFQAVSAGVNVPAGCADWGVGGFALTKRWNEGKTSYDKLITNLTKDPLTITSFPPFGITNMLVQPLISLLYADTDTAFATNLMPALAAGSGYAARGGDTLTPFLNLLPSVAGQPRTVTGRSITAHEVVANSDGSGLIYGLINPTVGDGTAATGGITVTLTEPIAGASPRVTVLTATITA